jgi:hypothetical protein
MIPLAAQPVQISSPATPSLAGTATAPGANGAQTGGFAGLLELTTAPPEGQAAADTADAAAAGAASLLRLVAAPAMRTGKILPGLAADPATAATAPDTQTPDQDVSLALRLPQLAMPTLAATARQLRLQAQSFQSPAQSAAKTASKDGADDAADAAQAAAADPAAQILALIPGLAAPTDPAAAATAHATGADANPGASSGALAMSPLVAAQMNGLPLRAANAEVQNGPMQQKPDQQDQAQAGQSRLLTTAAQRPDLAAGAAGFTLSDGPAPAAGAAGAVHLKLAQGERPLATADALTAPALADGSAFAQPVAGDGSVVSTAGANGTTTATPALHDFGAIVDRLMEARDAAGPRDVNVAVNHADFGPVSLHFRHDEAGLSVSVASADPEFARAINAAVPAASAAASADNGSGGGQNGGQNGGQQQAAGQTATQTGTGNPQGQNQPRAALGSDGPAANPARPGQTDPEAPAARRGRFA